MSAARDSGIGAQAYSARQTKARSRIRYPASAQHIEPIHGVTRLARLNLMTGAIEPIPAETGQPAAAPET